MTWARELKTGKQRFIDMKGSYRPREAEKNNKIIPLQADYFR